MSASTRYGEVAGYLIAGYGSGPYSTARFGGSVGGLAAGDKSDIVKLYAQPFPFRERARVVATSARLGAAKRYSFAQIPTVLTRYQARLFASAAADRPLAASPVRAVYVVAGGSVTGIRKCSRPMCRQAVTLTIYVPPSALLTEMAKQVYPYFAVSTGAAGAAGVSPPAVLYLDGGKAQMNRPVRLAADSYKVTVGFTFDIGTRAYSWNWAACAPDAIGKDGLGLPGSHGCGARSVSVNTPYLG